MGIFGVFGELSPSPQFYLSKSHSLLIVKVYSQFSVSLAMAKFVNISNTDHYLDLFLTYSYVKSFVLKT